MLEFWILESILVIAAVLVLSLPGAPDVKPGSVIVSILAITGFRAVVFATTAGTLSHEQKQLIESQTRTFTLAVALAIDALPALLTLLLFSRHGGQNSSAAELTALQKITSFVVAPLIIVATLIYSPRLIAIVVKWTKNDDPAL